MTTAGRAYAALPSRRACPRAVCIVSSTRWSAAIAIRSPGCGKRKTGRQWLTRLVVATLYTFGLKRGVGLDTMSEFFARLRLATQVGCSPSALRGVMQALEARCWRRQRRGRSRGGAAERARDHWRRG